MTSFEQFLGREGIRLSFAWGLAEAILFFLVPDIAVGAAALAEPRRWWRAAVAAIAGALVGGPILFLAASASPELGGVLLEVVPGIPGSMVDQAATDLAAHGGRAMVGAPLAGIPYKVFAVEAPATGVGFWSFLLWSLPARALRIVPVAALAAGASVVVRRLGIPARWTLGSYGALWIGIYAAYFAAVAA